MSHYEERLEQDLRELRGRVKAVGKRVETAFRDSIQACLTVDRQLASRTILGDLGINREIRRIDRVCHAFVARHLPSAGHLRFVSSVLRLDVALERIGDYAVAVGRETVQLLVAAPPRVARDIELIADQALRMQRRALRSFHEGDPELARSTKAMSSQVESTFQKVFDDLLEAGERDGMRTKDLVALLVIINRIGRVADQAKNICEETIFTVTGETKTPKVYRVLFVDRRNDGISQLAMVFARKAFPNSGRYTSAGWAPADDLDPQLEIFLGEHGYETGDLTPQSLEALPGELSDFHVIVDLGGAARSHLDELPFHTTLLEWDLGFAVDGLDQQRVRHALEEVYKRLTVQVGELMALLRGAGAD